MSVYIKGMDMPTNCTDCCYRPLVGCNPYQDNGLSPSDHRHRTCPLIEVPEPQYMQQCSNRADLIRRADAIKAVRKELVCDGRHETHDKVCRFIADVLLPALPSAESVSREEVTEIKNNYINEISELLNKIDALSAEPKTGEWIDTGNWMGVECSRCKCHSRYVTPFCPQCGARMRGEEE